MPEWQFSSSRMTVWVLESDGVITDSAPIVRKFTGQPVANLERWMNHQGGFMIRKLKSLSSIGAPVVLDEVANAASGVLELPTEVKKPDFNIGGYIILIYGREKIGKTTLCSTFPETIFFATEPGTKGLGIYELNANAGGVKNWDIFRQGVDLLEKSNRFKTVVIDTVDLAYDHCLDWVCNNRDIEYPGTDSDGDADYGKSWRAVKQEFVHQVHRIAQTGRGIIFTSHAKEENVKTRTGDKYDRIYPTVSKQGRLVVQAIVDMFLFIDYMRDRQGQTRRIIVTEGDELVWAGSRTTQAGIMPRFLPLERVNGYKVLLDAFQGKHPGINSSELLPTRSSAEPTKQMLRTL